jgi:hypothetical protein
MVKWLTDYRLSVKNDPNCKYNSRKPEEEHQNQADNYIGVTISFVYEDSQWGQENCQNYE